VKLGTAPEYLKCFGKVQKLFEEPGAVPLPLAFCLQEPDEYCQALVDQVEASRILEKAFFMALLLEKNDINLEAIAEVLNVREDELLRTLINYGFRIKEEDEECLKRLKRKYRR
jgi:hypothetical protein